VNHTEARQCVIEGFGQLYGREPTITEAQAAQGVGLLESHYGQGWKGAGAGSKNWGAVQKKRPPCDETSFLYTDTHPNADGTSTAYSVCFWRYATDAEGAAGLMRVMYGTVERPKKALERARAGDLYGVSAAMRAAGYYEGFGKTQADRIANHFRALSNCVRAICAELNEPFPSGKPTTGQGFITLVQKALPKSINPTIRRGSRGTTVRDWQRAIGVVTDGVFGPLTEKETISWQTAHALEPDGIVGPKTWTALEALLREAA
jgi:putative peptidoglycan binding protein